MGPVGRFPERAEERRRAILARHQQETARVDQGERSEPVGGLAQEARGAGSRALPAMPIMLRFGATSNATSRSARRQRPLSAFACKRRLRGLRPMLHPDQEGRAHLGNQNHSVAIRVTGCCPRAAAAAAAWVLYFGSPLVAQTVGTVDIGASVVEYDGFLVSGAAVLSPALHFNAPNISVGAQGAWTVFESGNQVLQASAAAAWIAPSRQWWRVEFSGSVGASRYADETGYGHLLARARVHFFGQRAGGWVGGTTGGSFGESNRTPFELAVATFTYRGTQRSTRL